MKKILVNFLKIGLSLGIVAWLILDATKRGGGAFTDESGNFAPDTFHAVLRHGSNHWVLILIAWLACAGAVVLTLIRWYYLVRALDLPFRLKDALRLGFLGYLFNLAPFGIVGGDLLKGWMLAREQHGRRAEAVTSVVVDRLIGLYSLFVVAAVAVLIARYWRTDVAAVQWMCQITLGLACVGTVMVAVVLFLPSAKTESISQWFGRALYVGHILKRLLGAVLQYRKKKRVLLGATLISLGVHSLFTLGVFLTACGLYDRSPTLGVHFVIGPVSAATGVIPLAMGPFEYMLDRLYILAPVPGGLGMEPGHGLVVAFVYRIFTVLIALVGVGFYLASRHEVSEVLHDSDLPV